MFLSHLMTNEQILLTDGESRCKYRDKSVIDCKVFFVLLDVRNGPSSAGADA